MRTKDIRGKKELSETKEAHPFRNDIANQEYSREEFRGLNILILLCSLRSVPFWGYYLLTEINHEPGDKGPEVQSIQYSHKGREDESRGVKRYMAELHIRFIEIIPRFALVSRGYFLRAGVGGITGYLCLLMALIQKKSKLSPIFKTG